MKDSVLDSRIPGPKPQRQRPKAKNTLSPVLQDPHAGTEEPSPVQC